MPLDGICCEEGNIEIRRDLERLVLRGEPKNVRVVRSVRQTVDRKKNGLQQIAVTRFELIGCGGEILNPGP